MKQLFREVSWASAGQVINVAVALLTLKVWAVYLTPAELGLMAIIISTASILAGIVVDPVVRAMLVRYSIYAEAGKEKEFRVVCLAVITRAAVMCVFAIVLIGVPVCHLLDLHWSTPLLVTGLFVIDARRCFEQTLLAAGRNQHSVAMVSVGDVSIRLIFLWLFLEGLGTSAYVAVAGNLFGALIVLTSLLVMTRSSASLGASSIDRDAREKISKEILQIAWPIVPSNIFANVSEMSSRYIITAMLSLHHAGAFVAAYGLVKRPFGMLSDIGYVTMLPAYVEAIAKNNSHEAGRIKFIWLFSIISLSFIGAALFYALGDLITAVLLSEKYAIVSDYLFSIGIVISIFNVIAVLNGILLAHGSSRSILIGNAMSAVLSVVMLFALIPLYGLHGCVWAIGISYLLQFALLLVIFLRHNWRKIII